jgi:serine/threonine protein kinase
MPFFGVSFDFDRPSAPCLVSPYYRNGNITSYLKKQPAVDKLALVSYMIKSIEGIPYSISSQLAQVASGLSYLHGVSVVHGELKGVRISAEPYIYVSYQLQSNILIDDDGAAAIADFGLARVLQMSDFTSKTASPASGNLTHIVHEQSATCEGEEFNPVTTDGWRWKAFELMTASLEETTTRVTIETDVWAFSMTVIEVRASASPPSASRH